MNFTRIHKVLFQAAIDMTGYCSGDQRSECSDREQQP